MAPQWSTGEEICKFIRIQSVFTFIEHEQRPITNAMIDNAGATCCQTRRLNLAASARR